MVGIPLAAAIAGIAASVVAVLLGLGAIARGIWRANRRLVHISDAVVELFPNSGESMRDRVERIDRSVIELTRRFDEHLERHR